jgi:type I restriction enzyme S subunit
MKNSGIEWLGEIPAHWDVVRVKHVVDKIEQGWSPQCEAAPVDSPDQWGVLKVGCVNGERFNPHENKVLPSDLKPLPDLAIRAGDVLVSRANTRELVGSAAVVEQDFDRLLLCDKLYRLGVDPNVAHPAFLTHYLRSSMARGQIQVAATGASNSMLNIGQGVIMELPFTLPPLAEQASVVDQIAAAQAGLADLVAAAQSAITLLQERRAALISAAVTGKIDVRGSEVSAFPPPLDHAQAERVQPSLRAVVGGIVVLQLGLMGRMAVMKGGYLAEAHCGLRDLGGRYERYAAGPYDPSLIAAMERGAADLCGVRTNEPAEKGEPVTYIVPKLASAPVAELRALVGEERAQRLSRLLADLSGIGRDGVEAVATIYAVWNDLLAADRPTDDDAIFTGVLSDWHDEKAKKFKRADLELWIAWMRRNGVVPNGNAPRTDHQGNLFA